MIYTVDTTEKRISFKDSESFKRIVETIEMIFGNDDNVRIMVAGENISLLECRRKAGTISNPRQSNVK